jgi:2-amino-4-hydroxy-6-hydroxymethyldihydropteridine diphosphokinase
MRAVIALGANIGEPQEQMELAVALLRESLDVIAVSTFHRTAPVGGPEQPDYLNAVVIAESDLSAMELLSLLHGIEKTLGRERIEHWGPRTMDCDLIQYGSIISKAEELTLPHPRAYERTFVLEPWLEIEPEAILLTHGKVADLLAALQ